MFEFIMFLYVIGVIGSSIGILEFKTVVKGETRPNWVLFLIVLTPGLNIGLMVESFYLSARTKGAERQNINRR